MIDIHTHVLPNVDDGSSSITMSTTMLKMLISEGVDTVILTPHHDKLEFDKKDIIDRFNSFKEQINLPIRLLLGSEIYYYEHLLEDLRKNKDNYLFINNSKYLLLEFSLFHKVKIDEVVYELSMLGFIPIVAHIERYHYLSFSEIDRIKKYALIQVNSENFKRRINNKILKYLLKKDYIDFIASDCHNDKDRRPDFSFAKKYILKKHKSQYDKLFNNNFLKDIE